MTTGNESDSHRTYHPDNAMVESPDRLQVDQRRNAASQSSSALLDTTWSLYKIGRNIISNVIELGY